MLKLLGGNMTENPLDNLKKYRSVVLASASPRRRELLSMLGIDFTVKPLTDVDESYPETLSAVDVPLYLAEKKCNASAKILEANKLIITADTVVICNDTVLGKPKDESEARAMLQMLSGKTHTVATGVAVATNERTASARALTEVKFATLSESEIDFYINRYRPFDKAGAYGIQEWIGCIGISHIDGSFYNVMGLPLHLLYNLLRTF